MVWDGELPASTWNRIARSDGHTEVLRELKARAKWYEGRAGAQLPRFDTVRVRGTRSQAAVRRVCFESPGEPICTWRRPRLRRPLTAARGR